MSLRADLRVPLGCRAGIELYQCATSITDSTIEGYPALTHGARLEMQSGSLTLTRTRIASNTAAGHGSGISATKLAGGAGPTLDLFDSLVTANSVGNGSLYVSDVAVSCTGTAAGSAGVVGNTGNGLVVDVGVGTFAANLCDFGSTVASSNTPARHPPPEDQPRLRPRRQRDLLVHPGELRSLADVRVTVAA